MNRFKTTLSVAALSGLLSSLLFLWNPAASAVATRSFSIDSGPEFASGELEGATALSSGALQVGVRFSRLGLEGASLIYSLARGEDGTIFAGTGDEGKVFAVRNGESRLLAETGQLMVTSLYLRGDTLFAGTMPEGRIFAIETGSGEMRELARPEGAEHIWDLDVFQGRLVAGTGPEGQVVAISDGGATEVLYDTPQSHVMALDVDGEALYAGTDGESIVYRISGPGSAEVVRDFEGTEITDLDAHDGTLAVAVNEMPAPRRATKAGGSRPGREARPRPGKGRFWRVDANGRAELLHSDDDTHFTSVRISSEGTMFVGTGKDGRLLRVQADGTTSVWADVEERQVLDIVIVDGRPVFSTGDSGAIYQREARAAEGVWTSNVLDAEFRSRFGQLHWRGEGAIELQTRSGNTAEPDGTWSAWSSALSEPGVVRSPAARFVQVRAQLEGDAELWAIQLYYLPQNQRATVENVRVHQAASKNRDAIPEASTELPLRWSISNPDGDPLRYRLDYRGEGQARWREIFSEDHHLTKNQYNWETSGIPDGWYVVRVSASDENANPGNLALTTEASSEPLRIDNHPPTVENLSVQRGVLRGRARDVLGPVSRLEVSIDGQDWRPLHSTDQLLDTAVEEFELTLGELTPGEHIVAVRARDAAGNQGIAETSFEVR